MAPHSKNVLSALNVAKTLRTHSKNVAKAMYVWRDVDECAMSRGRMHRIVSRILISRVKCTIESCHLYGWVVSHIWMSHVTHMNESCRTYEWGMSHIWISHVAYIHVDECATSIRQMSQMISLHQEIISLPCMCDDSFVDKWDKWLNYLSHLSSHESNDFVSWQMSQMISCNKSCHTYMAQPCILMSRVTHTWHSLMQRNGFVST